MVTHASIIWILCVASMTPNIFSLKRCAVHVEEGRLMALIDVMMHYPRKYARRRKPKENAKNKISGISAKRHVVIAFPLHSLIRFECKLWTWTSNPPTTDGIKIDLN